MVHTTNRTSSVLCVAKTGSAVAMVGGSKFCVDQDAVVSDVGGADATGGTVSDAVSTCSLSGRGKSVTVDGAIVVVIGGAGGAGGGVVVVVVAGSRMKRHGTWRSPPRVSPHQT